jgi:tetratricopeptide (TPR) repeat protein
MELKINGRGVWLLVIAIDKETAENYVKYGIPDYDIENFHDESEGDGAGFYSDAQVFLDDILIGTIESIIKNATIHPKHLRLMEYLNKKFILNYDNALVDVQLQKGTFVSAQIPNYDMTNGKPSDEFINDFLNSLDFDENACAFSINEWDDKIDGMEDGFDTWATSDIRLVFQGKDHQYDIIDGEDEDEYNDAAEYFHRRALEICKKKLGLKNSETLVSMNNFGVLLRERGKYDEAETILKNVISLFEDLHGKNALELAPSLSALGLTLVKKKNYEDAQKLYQRVLSIRTEFLGENDSATILTRERIKDLNNLIEI